MQGKFIAYIADFGAYYLMQKLLHIKSVCRKSFCAACSFHCRERFFIGSHKKHCETTSLAGRDALSG